jgi:hypothetical protein
VSEQHLLEFINNDIATQMRGLTILSAKRSMGSMFVISIGDQINNRERFSIVVELAVWTISAGNEGVLGSSNSGAEIIEFALEKLVGRVVDSIAVSIEDDHELALCCSGNVSLKTHADFEEAVGQHWWQPRALGGPVVHP